MRRRKRAEAATPNPYISQDAQENVLFIQQYAECHSEQLTVNTNNTNGYLQLKFTLTDRPQSWYLMPDAVKISRSQAGLNPAQFQSHLLRCDSLLECLDTDRAAVVTAARPRKRQAVASAGASEKPKPHLTKNQEEGLAKHIERYKSLVPNVEKALAHNMQMFQKHSSKLGLTFRADKKTGLKYHFRESQRSSAPPLNIMPYYLLTEDDMQVTPEKSIEHFFSRGAITACSTKMIPTLQGLSCSRSKAWEDGSISVTQYACHEHSELGTDKMTIVFKLQGASQRDYKRTVKIKRIDDAGEDKRRRDDLLRSLIMLYKEATKEGSELNKWSKLPNEGLVNELLKIAEKGKLLQISKARQKKKTRPCIEPPKATSSVFAPEGILGPPTPPPEAPTQAAAGSGQSLQMDLAEPAAAGQSLDIIKKTDILVMYWGEKYRPTINRNLQFIEARGKDKVQIDFNSTADTLVLKPMIPSATPQQEIHLIPTVPIFDLDDVFNQDFSNIRKTLIQGTCAVAEFGIPQEYAYGISCSAHSTDYWEGSVAAYNATNREDYAAGNFRIRLTFIGKQELEIVANGAVTNALAIQSWLIACYMENRIHMDTFINKGKHEDVLNFWFTYAAKHFKLSIASKVERLETAHPITEKRTKEDSKASIPVRVASNPLSIWTDVSQTTKATTDEHISQHNDIVTTKQ